MSELEKKGKKRTLEEYFDDESIQTEISNAWEAINDSQDAEEVPDDNDLIVAIDEDDVNEPDTKKRKTEEPVKSVFKVPCVSATGSIKYSQQAVYKKLNEQKLSKFMKTIECNPGTEDSSVASSCPESVDTKTIYSNPFEDEPKVISDNLSDHLSIQSKDEYIELKKRDDGKIKREVVQVDNDNINKLKNKFENIIKKYKEDREKKEFELDKLEELEKDYSEVFGNIGLLFYKYKKDKSNLHNAFFPTLLGKNVNLDEPTFDRIYKKQMVLDLCLFVYNLNLFECINKPYTYITYNFVANDDATKGSSTLFSVANSISSSKSNRVNIKKIRKEQNKEGIDVKQLNKSEFVEKEVNEPLTEPNSQVDSDLEGGKKSKSNQGGKKGPNKGPKKNHKTNKKRSNRSFMMKSKKSKPRKTQRKKNNKKKTQRKKLVVKKDLKKKTKRVRFAL